MNTVGPGIWGENGKTWKMSKGNCKDLEYGEKTEKSGK